MHKTNKQTSIATIKPQQFLHFLTDIETVVLLTIMNHDDIVTDICATLDKAEPPLIRDCCIYRVPSLLRKLKEDAYTPKVVSIGPFHHHLPTLQNMEPKKLFYFKSFLQRTNTTLHTFTHYIQSILPKFKRCYSETVEFTPEELVKLILIDSCFIIELFWRIYYDDWSEDDAYHFKPWLGNSIVTDLLLLENQLPFFVLENIFNLAFTSSSHASAAETKKIPTFLELTFHRFRFFNRSNLASNDISIKHFTDLIRIFHLQHPLERRPRRMNEVMENIPKHIPSVTEMLEAGVKFKVNSTSKCLFDLRFSRGVLEIPQLAVGDFTEILFRNMVALEQCYYPSESYITDYVDVLNFFISTNKDVDILVQKGILVNWLGDSHSVTNLFNSLLKNVVQYNINYDYFVLCKQLNDFCSDPSHILMATLRRDYCNTPWQTAASIAGIILLILSFLQSVCSVLQIVYQCNNS